MAMEFIRMKMVKGMVTSLSNSNSAKRLLRLMFCPSKALLPVILFRTVDCPSTTMYCSLKNCFEA